MKGAVVKVDPELLVVALRENQEAHAELDQYGAPAGTLRERIQAVVASLNVALQKHKDVLDGR